MCCCTDMTLTAGAARSVGTHDTHESLSGERVGVRERRVWTPPPRNMPNSMERSGRGDGLVGSSSGLSLEAFDNCLVERPYGINE